eukprot:jgi/Chlat1/5443/Chrsp36S05414
MEAAGVSPRVSQLADVSEGGRLLRSHRRGQRLRRRPAGGSSGGHGASRGARLVVRMGQLEDSIARSFLETKIHRQRKASLLETTETKLPYILLSESEVCKGDTVVRQGVVVVQKPVLLLLDGSHRHADFEGFESESQYNSMFALARAVSFPAGKYRNIDVSLDVHELPVEDTLENLWKKLEREGDSQTGLLTGPPEHWPMCVLAYVAQVWVEEGDRRNELEAVLRRMTGLGDDDGEDRKGRGLYLP